MAQKKKSAPATEAERGEAKIAEAEEEKLRGQTDEQQELRDYHEGKFQTHDPVTGEKRDAPLLEDG
jgi:hypothetical protein